MQYGVEYMTTECKDKNCYVHGDLSVRGGRLGGIVVSNKGKNSVVVERDATNYVSKYKRYARERSRIAAHNPPCINAKVGDMVMLGETRKISKTKAWTVLKVEGA
ncbi:MAG: 30S ribosomal protein S17 [Candidatus Micrarchaeota archaeon]